MELIDQIKKAEKAANEAASLHLRNYGEGAYCGFAWVEIPDGRCKLVREMKRQNIGSKHWRKGWMVWSPGSYSGQSMDVHEVAARAYAASLREHGHEVFMRSRAD